MIDIDDLQADLPEIVAETRKLLHTLECAESCEVSNDFEASIKQGLILVAQIRDSLRAIAKQL